MSAQVTYLGTSIAGWVGALSSSDPLQRRLGAYALGEIGPAASEAVPNLAAALEDPVRFVRVWAAAALAQVAPSGGESVTVLIAEMGDELAFVRSLAAWHLGRLGPAFPGIDQALLPLRWLADDRDPSVRAEAALALGMLEGKGAPPPELKFLSREGTGRLAPGVAGLRATVPQTVGSGESAVTDDIRGQDCRDFLGSRHCPPSGQCK
jgi:HEAT repeat protein